MEKRKAFDMCFKERTEVQEEMRNSLVQMHYDPVKKESVSSKMENLILEKD
jgi:predicted phosphohydrolase